MTTMASSFRDSLPVARRFGLDPMGGKHECFLESFLTTRFPTNKTHFWKAWIRYRWRLLSKEAGLVKFHFFHQVFDEVMAASGLTCSAGYRNHSFWRTMYSAVRYESAAIVAVAGYAVNVGKTDAPRMNRLWMSWDWQ